MSSKITSKNHPNHGKITGQKAHHKLPGHIYLKGIITTAKMQSAKSPPKLPGHIYLKGIICTNKTLPSPHGKITGQKAHHKLPGLIYLKGIITTAKMQSAKSPPKLPGHFNDLPSRQDITKPLQKPPKSRQKCTGHKAHQNYRGTLTTYPVDTDMGIVHTNKCESRRVQ